MSLRVLCDTNVLVSALISAGPPSRLLEEAIDGQLELVLADPVLRELSRVLTAKLGYSERRWREVETFLIDTSSERVATPTGRPPPASDDRADDLILWCAVRAVVDVVATGDRRHLLPLGEWKGIRLLPPQAVLAEVRRS